MTLGQISTSKGPHQTLSSVQESFERMAEGTLQHVEQVGGNNKDGLKVII